MMRTLRWISVAALATFCMPAFAVVPLNERSIGLYGACVDANEQPVEGCKVTLKPIGASMAPVSMESNKKGFFIFPRLELLNDGYEMSVEKEGWFVRSFEIRTRRGTREIWQEDKGQLVPTAQKFPPVRYRGANATVLLVMQTIDEYRAQRQAEAQAEATKQAAEEDSVARPQAKQGATLTIADQGREALALGDLAGAVEKFGLALEGTPDDVETRWLLAQTLAKREDWGGAMREAMKVLRVDPARAGVNLSVARWLGQQGQPPESAIPYLEKERELDASRSEVHQRLVEAYTSAGRQADARAALDAWLVASPENAEALLALASIKSSEGKLQEAEDLFRRVAASDPVNADKMFFNAGATIMSRSSPSAEERKRAVAAFEKAIEINPSYARAHLELAYALVGLGDRAKAREHFQKFIDLAPNDARAKEAKGMLDALRG